jgi:sugar/nucleoside kinase (ribokinase family)
MNQIMNQTLVIGSTVVDVLISLPALPRRGEDVNISAPEYRIGGCAYNVYKTLMLFKSPALLCSPVGTGIYGSMVRENLEREDIPPFVSLEEENGCCYCLIEPDGERSFLSHHGAEYLFSRSWMKGIDFSKTGSAFICGIEVEDPTGAEIVDFACEHPELKLYFAPGPRIMHISPLKMERLLRRRDREGRGPFLHFNETEALSFACKQRVEDAATHLAERTGNSVVITLGERGCYCFSKAEGKGNYIPGFPARVADTVGAGDAHCGALIAYLESGKRLEDACLSANKAGAAAVGRR